MMLTKQRADMAVTGLKDRLKQRFGNKVGLCLFGSVARGDFGPESDIDVLVLLDGDLTPQLEKEIINAAFNIELDHEVVFGLMIESTRDWQSPLFRAMPIHQIIDEEGVLI